MSTSDRKAARPDSESRQEWRFIVVLFVAALCVRALFYWQAYGTPLFHAPMVDESWHDQWANELLDNGWAYPQVYFRGPGYPYFLAALYAVSGRSIAFARAMQLVLSSLSVVLCYLLARRLFSRRVARTGAVFLCFYGTIIWYEQALLIAVLSIFLNLLLLYLLVRYREGGSLTLLGLSGLVAGLSLIARPNLAVFVLGAAVWLVWTGKRTGWRHRFLPGVVLLACAGLPVIPVTYHNWVYSGDFIPIASQGGVNFYLGNNPVADGLTMRMPELEIDEALPWDEFVPATDSIASRAAGRELSPGEVSSFWTGRFVDFVVSQPGQFALGLLRKTFFFFNGTENSDNFDLYFYRRINPVYAAMVWRFGLHVPFGLVSPLAILGMIWLWPRRREFAVLYLFVFLYTPTVIGVLVTARHRLPVVLIMVLFAAYAAFELHHRLRSGTPRTRAALAAAVLGLFIVTNLELFGLGYENVRQSHINLSLAYRKLGDYEGEVRELDLALAADSSSVVALNARGVAYLRDGDLYMAKNMFRLALSLAPRSKEVRNNLATVLMRQGAWQSALLIYKELAVVYPGLAPPLLNMASIYASRQVYDTALILLDSALARDSLYVEAMNNQASVFEQLGRADTALATWKRAASLRPDYGPAAQNLVRLFAAQALHDSAVALLERATPPWRGSEDWYYLYVREELALGKRDRAGQMIAEAVGKYPESRPLRSLAVQLRTD